LELKDVFDEHESTDEQNHEDYREKVEVLVDEVLDGGAEEIYQTRNEEKAKAPPYCRGYHEESEIKPEEARGYGEHLIRDRRDGGCEHAPEAISVIEQLHLIHHWLTVIEIDYRPSHGLVPVITDGIAESTAEYRANGAYEGISKCFSRFRNSKRHEKNVRRHGEE